MISVWTHQDNIPKFARLDYWVGNSLIAFGIMLSLFTQIGFISLVSSFGTMVLGCMFMFLLRFPDYLLETYDENGEVIDSQLVSINSYIFHIGLFRGQILSGPYFNGELNRLQQDLG